jgi:hypothetical protein
MNLRNIVFTGLIPTSLKLIKYSQKEKEISIGMTMEHFMSYANLSTSINTIQIKEKKLKNRKTHITLGDLRKAIRKNKLLPNKSPVLITFCPDHKSYSYIPPGSIVIFNNSFTLKGDSLFSSPPVDYNAKRTNR